MEYKTTRCIEHLPTVIFQIVQTYLSHEDYRSLMNCKKSNFRSIKYETIVYKLNPMRIRDTVEQNGNNIYDHLLNGKVKNKAKQIIISMEKVSPGNILHYAPYFQDIYQLSLYFVKGFKETFNFSLFNNIHTVKLMGFEGVKTISSGFENVKTLQIIYFNELESVTGINLTNTLQNVEIKLCNALKYLSFPTQDLVNLSVGERFLFDLSSFLNFVEKAKLRSLSVGCRDTIQTVLRTIPLDISSLHSLSLKCQFPSDFNDFCVFENIPELGLDCCAPSSTLLFTRFNGQYLRLTNFKISDLIAMMSQDESRFPKLRHLNLFECHDITHLTSLPNLTELHLTYCKGLKSISSFPELKSLSISFCSELMFIASDQPKLKTCEIGSCSKIEDLHFATSCQEVSLYENEQIQDVSMLGKVKSLKIHE